MIVGRPRLEPICRRGAFSLPLAGKFKRIRVRCVPLAIACDVALLSNELFIESCLVALSIARGEGMSGSEFQSWLITVCQRWAIELLGLCGSVSFWHSVSREWGP